MTIVEDSSQEYFGEARPGDGYAPVQSVYVSGLHVLYVVLHPGSLARAQDGIAAPGRETGDSKGCPKPGQKENGSLQEMSDGDSREELSPF